MTVFNSNDFTQASQFIQQGNLLAYPTEAVWGIGCDPFNEQAVGQILTIKNRPLAKGMIMIAPSIASIQPFFQNLSDRQTQAIIKSWKHQEEVKQATTWLFPMPQYLPITIPNWVTGGRDNLAIRVISHPTIAQLCQLLISPHNPYGFLIATSCNPAGEIPAENLTQAQNYFDNRMGYFNDKTLGFTQPSQIINAVTGEKVRN